MAALKTRMKYWVVWLACFWSVRYLPLLIFTIADFDLSDIYLHTSPFDSVDDWCQLQILLWVCYSGGVYETTNDSTFSIFSTFLTAHQHGKQIVPPTFIYSPCQIISVEECLHNSPKGPVSATCKQYQQQVLEQKVL